MNTPPSRAEIKHKMADIQEKVAQIAAYLRLIHPDQGTVFEVRVLGAFGTDPEKPETWRAWYCTEDIDRAAEEIAAFDDARAPRGVYCTFNPCRPELLNRGSHLAHGSATNDSEIAKRCLFIVDIDPERAEGSKKDSVTPAEKEAAYRVLQSVQQYLTARRWPAPLLMDSGNGWYLLYRIDLPNDIDRTELVKKCLAALAQKFDTQDAHVDRGMYNASRIARVAGTLNRKGPGTTERPHRLANLPADQTGSLVVVRPELLANLAAEAKTVRTLPQRSTRPAGPCTAAATGSLLDLVLADGFILKQKNNRQEWCGPCPWCGTGEDRFIVGWLGKGGTTGSDTGAGNAESEATPPTG